MASLSRSIRFGGVALSTALAFALTLLGHPAPFAAGAEVLTGQLIELHGDDFVNSRVVDRHYVLKSLANDYRIIGPVPGNLAGSRVKVTGLVNARHATIDITKGNLELVANRVDAAPITNRSVALILLNFADNRSRPVTTTQATDVLLRSPTSVAAYFQEISYGRIGRFDGHVYGWYELGINSTCDHYEIAEFGATAASSDGFDAADYTNVMFAIPWNEACDWGGLGEIGGSLSWINGYVDVPGIMAHELGHNFGMGHASSLICSDEESSAPVSWSMDCQADVYGDVFDMMGMGAWDERWMGNWALDRLGWLNPDESLTVTSEGEYRLAPLGVEAGVPRLLRIPRSLGYQADFGAFDELLLEFRQPNEPFDNFAATDPVVNGVSVRFANSCCPYTYLLDMSPDEGGSFWDSVLYPGDEFVDSLSATRIKVVGVSGSGATLQISRVAGVPGAPTDVVVTLGGPWGWDAEISWRPPINVGNSPVSDYIVVASPEYRGCRTTGLTCMMPFLEAGTEYTFRVWAINAAGAGPSSDPSHAVIPAVVPDSPWNVTAMPGNRSAVVSWLEPWDGGSPIVSYTVSSSPDGRTCTSAGERTCIVSELTNGVTYTFSVVATNAVGDSPPSWPSNAVTPHTVPGPPSGVAAVPGNREALVSWLLPESDGGGSIVRYTVTSDPGHQVCLAEIELECVVTGLTNGAVYTFTVTATNDMGSGPASAPSNSVTPATTPEPPTGATASAGNSQATVSWAAPADDGGSPVIDYTVTSSPGAMTCATAGATSCTVPGLTNGFAYTFTVTASNAVGPSLPSAASNSVTPGTTGKPDGRIRKGSGAFVGNNIYSTTGVNQSVTGAAKKGRTVTFAISIQNDATASDSFTLTVSGTATTAYTVRYFRGRTDITAEILAGTYATPALAAGATYLIKAKVTVMATATRGSDVTRLVTITSLGDGTQDAVQFIAKRR